MNNNATKSQKHIILTGDRPTGKLHLGHFVGSVKNRVEMQNSGEFDEIFILIADTQALTDNFGNPQKVRDNVIEVMLDYLSCGIDPQKSHFVLQSQVPALAELTQYYMNLVTLPRVLRNPTVKSEIKLRGFDKDEQGLPVGFATYPISQAADITAFGADVVPVGDDQLPMIEQTREIVKSFNSLYGDVLVMPKAVLPKNNASARLPGIDGNAKMSKSLGNCIYLSDDSETLRQKVFQMYTDPNHIRVEDPGQIEGNMVFTYLDVFCQQQDFEKFLPEFTDLNDLKDHYRAGGVGDVKVKKFLFNILNEILAPIREKREYFQSHISEVLDILQQGTKRAVECTNEMLEKVKKAMGISYFSDDQFKIECELRYKK